MKALVTGGLGFIGSHLVTKLVEREYEVVVLDSGAYSARFQNLTEMVRDWSHLGVITGNVCSGALVLNLLEHHKPDVVYHLAAETHVTRSIFSPSVFLETNVVGTGALLEAIVEAKSKPRLVHVSTDEVYGSLDEDEPPFNESSRYDPRNPYAASKAASDHLVASYRNTYGLNAIVTHCSNNYGPRQHPEKLIPTLIRQCLNNEPMTLHGDGLHIRDWIHVDDHVEGLIMAGESEYLSDINFGGLTELTNQEVAHLVANALAAKRLSIAYVQDRKGNDRRYAMSIDIARNRLGWTPTRIFSEAIQETVNWYKQNRMYAEQYGHSS